MTPRDPFQPLSAKDAKASYSSGGREQDKARKNMSEAARLGRGLRKIAAMKAAKVRTSA